MKKINMSDLFPIYGVTLGKTTMSEIESNVGEVEKTSQATSAAIQDVFFVEVKEEECIRYAGINYSVYPTAEIPKKWRNALGLEWLMSEDDCKELLESKGYKIECSGDEFMHRSYYDTKVIARSPDGEIVIELLFRKDGLQHIMMSVCDCPKCNSKDIEIVASKRSDLSEYICNECGHRWGQIDE